MKTTKKATHLTHLEDLPLTYGIEGINMTIGFIEGIYNKYKTSGDSDYRITTKIDGAPALHFGTDPKTGKFFVGTKSVFNKITPKLVFGPKEAKEYYGDGGLGYLLLLALKHLSKIKLPKNTIMKGDVLLAGDSIDKKIDTIDGVKYLTIQPNTIVYAFPVGSDIANHVNGAEFGIAIHTKYTGTSEDISEWDEGFKIDAEMNSILSQAQKNKKVWITGVEIEDKGSVAFSKKETAKLEKSIEKVKYYSNKIQKDIEFIAKDKDTSKNLPIYVNKKIREGILVSNEDHVNEYIEFARARYKSDKKKDEIQDFIESYRESFINLFRLMSYINIAKQIFISKLERIETTKAFTKIEDGVYEVSKPEGFVSIDAVGNVVKLVDRLDFSKKNLLYGRFSDAQQNESTNFFNHIYKDVMTIMNEAKSELQTEKMDLVVETLSDMKNYNAVYVGRFQPPTIAHAKNIGKLTKKFKHVYVIMSEANNQKPEYLDKNPLSSKEREELFRSDKNIGDNVTFIGGATYMAFGAHNETARNDLYKTLGLSSEETVVVCLGKEDDRYYDMKEKGRFFVLNNGEKPSLDKPIGLYGMKLIDFGGDEKVSASHVRNAIKEGDFVSAKRIMAGDSKTQDKIIKMLNKKYKKINESFQDKYYIESLDVDKEIKNNKQNNSISEEDALTIIINLTEDRL